MLVLSREIDERIVIEFPGVPPVYVQVIEVRGQRARLSVDAPCTVRVDREEIFLRRMKAARR